MAKRINDLSTIKGITAQMRAVYRMARLNIPDEEISPQTAKILTDILKNIAVVHRDNELEQRISELEGVKNGNK